MTGRNFYVMAFRRNQERTNFVKRTNVAESLCLVALFLAVNLEVHAQTWSTTGSMGAQRAFHSATVLNNGEVLVAGGETGSNTACPARYCITRPPGHSPPQAT